MLAQSLRKPFTGHNAPIAHLPRRLGALGPRFDAEVPAGGYAWWYIDAFSTDGHHALTVIAFVGAAFSPAYFRERRRLVTSNPLSHCALNVAVYGKGPRAWTLTEYGADKVRRSPDHFELGASTVSWNGETLEVRIDERTPWLNRAIRGTIRLRPVVLHNHPEPLDPDARHLWWCLAPLSRVEVELSEPNLRFSGAGYLDANFGREPLEAGLTDWDWFRATSPGATLVAYDTRSRRGPPVDRAWRFTPDGGREPVEPPVRHALPRGRWGIPRALRADVGKPPQVVESLEDGPFYTRSLVRGRWDGEDGLAVHESISLDRFRSPVVRTMLPFRMRPRWMP